MSGKTQYTTCGQGVVAEYSQEQTASIDQVLARYWPGIHPTAPFSCRFLRLLFDDLDVASQRVRSGTGRSEQDKEESAFYMLGLVAA